MRQIIRRIPLVCLSVFLVCVAAAVPAQAQYFGRNKVQYKDFKFEVLKTEHFDIYFYDEERESAARVGRMAERWYARLSQHLRARDADAAAPRSLRLASGLRADQRRRRHDRRGHRRRHRRAEAPRRPAARRHARRDRPRARPRAGPCLPVRHRRDRARREATRGGGIEACRSGSSKAWPSTCRSDRSIRTRRCGFATRRARRSCRRSATSTTANSSRIGGDRPCGRISAASTATI